MMRNTADALKPSGRRFARGLMALLLLAPALAFTPAQPAGAETTGQTLPFTQDWSDASLISANDNWDNVPGIVGYNGAGLTSATDANPQMLLVDDSAPVVDVIANQTDTSLTNGGVAEFAIADPVVALQGSGTADAPYLLIHLNTTGKSSIAVSYILRDIDGSTDDAAQQVALQYRVGTTGDFVNVPAGYVPDATSGPSLATKTTPVSVVLPAAANNQPLVQLRIMTTNAFNNDEWVGVDDIQVVSDAPLPVTANCPANLEVAAGSAGAAALSATDADGTVTSASITSTPVAGITLANVVPATTAGGTATASLQVADSTAVGTYNVSVQFANNDTTPQTGTCTVMVSVEAPAAACGTAFTPIYDIQSDTSASPRHGQLTSTEGVVTADLSGTSGMNGFFIQDATGDGDPATSDGLFVFVPAANSLSAVDVQVGQKVRVSGTVEEFNTLTELIDVTDLQICGAATPIAPVVLDLPVDGIVNQPQTALVDYERFENMLVTITETLTVSQNFFQGRYGQVTLSADGRLEQPTNTIDPNEPNNDAVQAAAELNMRRTIVLDDGTSRQNPDPIPYLSPDNTLRAGDTTTDLTGVIDYGPINSNSAIRFFRLQPTVTPVFARVNQRTAAPDEVGGALKVASFNVLNYFTTIDQAGATCFPSGTRSDCRGADSAEEFERQSAKVVAAITALDADVVGLLEIENNGATAVGDLVDKLNAATAPGTYAAIDSPANYSTVPGGDDAIKVAMIYKPAAATPISPSLTIDDVAFTIGRAPLAQTFRLNDGSGETLSVIVNHFKSKSCDGAGGLDQDQGDGQGCFNSTRTQQAAALLRLIATVQARSGDTDVLVVGDLNSYGEEDPIDVLQEGGLIDQLAKRIADPYSYVFDGQRGYLDHALATASLDAKVSGVTEWHINADEPSVLDYNTEFKQPGLYTPTPYRSSDHDPVLIGLGIRAYLPLLGR